MVATSPAASSPPAFRHADGVQEEPAMSPRSVGAQRAISDAIDQFDAQAQPHRVAERGAAYADRWADASDGRLVTPDELAAALSGKDAATNGTFLLSCGGTIRGPLHISGDVLIDCRRYIVTVKHSSERDPALTLHGTPTVVGLRVVNPKGVAVKVSRGVPRLIDVRITDSHVGVSVTDLAEPLVARSHIHQCRVGIETGTMDRERGLVLYRTSVTHCGTHGVVAKAGTFLAWASEIAENGCCGIVFEGKTTTGVVRECHITRNGLQGIFAEGSYDRPPLIFGCTIDHGKASGVKVPARGCVTLVRCVLAANEYHDVDIEEHSLGCSVVGCRFLGGPSSAVVAWEGAPATFRGNSFGPYALWAFFAHQRARITLELNYFVSDVVADDAAVDLLSLSLSASGVERKGSLSESGEGAFGCSGMRLEPRVTGTAIGNVFVGWKPGVERGRTAFVVNSPAFNHKWHRAVTEADLDAQVPAIRAAALAVASQDPGRCTTLKLRSEASSDAGGAGSAPGGVSPNVDLGLLADILGADTSVCGIDARASGLADGAVDVISKRVVAKHPRLRSIDVSANPRITGIGFTALAEAAVAAPRLEEVHAERIAPLDYHALPHAVDAVRRNPRLTRFAVDRVANAHCRDMLDELDFMCGVNRVARTPEARRQLQLVHADSDQVCEADFGAKTLRGDEADDGAQLVRVVAYSLKRNTHVATLTLDAHALTGKTLGPLGEVVAASRTIKTISLAETGLREAGPLADPIAAAAHPTSLTALDLRGNDDLRGRRNVEALSSLFNAAGSAMRSLDIVGTGFSPADIDFLVAAVPRNLSTGIRYRVAAAGSRGGKPGQESADEAQSAPAADSQPQAKPGTGYRASRVQQPVPLRSI